VSFGVDLFKYEVVIIFVAARFEVVFVVLLNKLADVIVVVIVDVAELESFVVTISFKGLVAV